MRNRPLSDIIKYRGIFDSDIGDRVIAYVKFHDYLDLVESSFFLEQIVCVECCTTVTLSTAL